MTDGDGGLRLGGVAVWLGARALVPPLDLAIAPGAAATLMGPSGCGKSSLLAHICGMLPPPLRAAGEIWLDGRAITHLPPEDRRIGILFQDDLLFPHLSVGRNLAFAVPRSVRGAERRRRVDAALAEAGLDGFYGRDPATLSGGQRSRAALMRTLLAEPRALLLDEPFSRLDGPLRARMRATVFDHARRRGLATLLVTHDPDDATAAGGPIIVLASGENVD